jgi:DNA-binding CsgD family transcriptional regulator
MNPKPSHAVSPKELIRQEGLEPLTERELQTLHLLDKDLTNREIASELVVTSGTVKLHTRHVYRKPYVNNRQEAVTLARALGLAISQVLPFIPQGVGVTAGMAGVACAMLPLPLTVTLLLGLMGGQPDLLPVIAIGAVAGLLVSQALTPLLPMPKRAQSAHGDAA